MAKQKPKKKPKVVSAPEAMIAPATALGDTVVVKFIGQVRAVLAGRSILHGERRRVTNRQLDLAERARPGEWVVIEGKPVEGPPTSAPPDDDGGQG